MTISEILQSLRDCDYAECKEWADAIEAAMREPVAEVINGGGCWELQVLGSIDHGMKLYALPPDAAEEITVLREDKERLMNRIDGCHQSMREKDAEISGLKLVHDTWRRKAKDQNAEIERLREALEDAERVLAWGEPRPQPVLQRVRAALAGEEDV